MKIRFDYPEFEQLVQNASWASRERQLHWDGIRRETLRAAQRDLERKGWQFTLPWETDDGLHEARWPGDVPYTDRDLFIAVLIMRCWRAQLRIDGEKELAPSFGDAAPVLV